MNNKPLLITNECLKWNLSRAYDRIMATKGLKELLDDISMGDLTQTGEARKKTMAKLRDRLADLTEATKIVVQFLHTLEAAEGEPLTKTSAHSAENSAPREVRFFQSRVKHQWPVEPTGPLKLFEGSLPDVLYRILSEAGRPITWDELRDGLKKNPTMTKVDNDKSYYSGIQRLKEKGYCVSYKGRISTPENLKKFQDEVAAGRAVDVVVARHRNKWAEAILAFVRTRPNGTATFAEITEHLTTLPEIGDKLKDKKDSYVATTLSGMVYRTKVLEKLHRGVYRLKPEGVETDETLFGSSGAEAPEVRH